MKKLAKIKKLLSPATSDEILANKLRDLIDDATENVIEDLWNVLSKFIPIDKIEKAKVAKEVLLGQSKQDDYPNV
ncbi:MAG: hypothetical protein U1E10_19565 [Bdellovibrionales bacterium]|nr:hypothetical protein [Bdellovibrionales bacterium]